MASDLVYRLRRSTEPFWHHERPELVSEAADELERLRAERLKLDKRIHNQRVALRQTWEIVEMRRKWLGSDTARRMYSSLLKRYRALKAQFPI